MQKHTKGPWVIGQESTDLMACPEGGRFHAIDAPAGNHYALAVVVTQLSNDYPKGSRCEQLMANARLIAAAPELLAALMGMDEALCRNNDTIEDRHQTRLNLIAARTAIAKATGAAS